MFVSWYRFYSGTAFTPAEISSCVGICHHNMEITLSDIIFSVLVLIPRSAFTLTPLLHAYKPSQAKDTKPIPNTKAQRPRTTHCLLVRGGRAPACEVYVGCCSLRRKPPSQLESLASDAGREAPARMRCQSEAILACLDPPRYIRQSRDNGRRRVW